MLRLSDTRNFFILTPLFFLCCYDANSSSIAAPTEPLPQISVNPGCNINFDQKTRQLTLVSKIAVNARLSRARCIIRINPSNSQKQFRLVPLAFKGEVKKAPAQVAISSLLIGSQPTSLVYPNPSNVNSLKFDLTRQILPTSYTTQGKSVLGINIVLIANGGELELTEAKFLLQQK